MVLIQPVSATLLQVFFEFMVMVQIQSAAAAFFYVLSFQIQSVTATSLQAFFES